jgi:hypothetical protein
MKVRRSVLVEIVDGQAVLLDVDSSTYFSTNQVGALVLKGLQDGGSVQSVVASLTAEFDVDAEQAEADVLAFCERLRVAGMLEE